jgi:hypothetical protein|tara:strand:+ start:147 stop:746 length:600 start_codon:yes stop_codon:yes gene_type:complete
MHVKLSDLPAHVSAALKRAGHTRRDIELTPASTVDSPCAGDGIRAVVAAIDLATGRSEVRAGSWGGTNPFEKRGADYMRSMPVPQGAAVYLGYQGGRLSGFGRLAVNPADMSGLALPGPVGLTDDERAALYVMRARKPAYRAEWLAKATQRRVSYSADDPTFAGLASKGLVKISKSKSMRITTDGKNAIGCEAAFRRFV